MEYKEKRWFDDHHIIQTPDAAGHYALFSGRELIAIGYAADSVRDRLFDHLEGRYGWRTAEATTFAIDPSAPPDTRDHNRIVKHRRRVSFLIMIEFHAD